MPGYFPPTTTKDFGINSINLDLNEAKLFDHLQQVIFSLKRTGATPDE